MSHVHLPQSGGFRTLTSWGAIGDCGRATMPADGEDAKKMNVGRGVLHFYHVPSRWFVHLSCRGMCPCSYSPNYLKQLEEGDSWKGNQGFGDPILGKKPKMKVPEITEASKTLRTEPVTGSVGRRHGPQTSSQVIWGITVQDCHRLRHVHAFAGHTMYPG